MMGTEAGTSCTALAPPLLPVSVDPTRMACLLSTLVPKLALPVLDQRPNPGNPKKGCAHGGGSWREVREELKVRGRWMSQAAWEVGEVSLSRGRNRKKLWPTGGAGEGP